MQILVENVAKILKADIILDGVTVIAGYNNMGKSTILKAAYIVFNTFRNANHKVISARKRSIENYILNQESYFDNHGYGDLPRTLLNWFADKINENLADFINGNKDNYSFFKSLFLESFELYLSVEGWSYEDEEGGIESDEFIRPLYDKINEIFTRGKEEDLKYIAEMYIRNIFKGQMNSLHNKSHASIKIDSNDEHYFMAIKENRIYDMKYSFNTEADVFYLPACNLLDIVDSAFRSKYSPEYDINSALQSQELDPTFEMYQEIEDNTKLIREIFQEVIHGKIEKLPSGKFSYRDEDIDDSINIGNVASGMKNFLIIQTLVEKGRLKRNSILLIDEPETNLHPEWHLKFAEILVLMYKEMGVRSIVNSHSPYFIRALEVQMANHGIRNKGHYYLMEETDKNLFKAQDVSETTDKIYELLYKPMEYL